MQIGMLSNQGRPLETTSFGDGKRAILVVGGVHGDEIEGVNVCDEFAERIKQGRFELPPELTVTIFSRANPDGTELKQRTNANNVDLNRNLPTSNWRPEATNSRYPPGASAASEIETKFFINLVNQIKPQFIISMHSYTESLLLFPKNEVNQPFRSIIDATASAMKIPVVDKMNYEIFGSLSRWGFEQKIPTLTIEILRTGTSALTNKWADQLQLLINAISQTT